MLILLVGSLLLVSDLALEIQTLILVAKANSAYSMEAEILDKPNTFLKSLQSSYRNCTIRYY